jgi:uncharacterized repeat protein (TIGR01451 family)
MNNVRNIMTKGLMGILLSAISLGALAQVELKTEMFKVVSIQRDNGTSKTEWVNPDNITPGDKVGYRILVENKGNKPAEDIVLNNPVPENTIYIDGSARGANSSIVFSVDQGKTFGTPENLFIMKDGKKIPATANNYSNVRWILTSPLKAGGKGSVQYVVQVK